MILDKIIELALQEDLSLGDITSDTIFAPSDTALAAVKAKEDLAMEVKNQPQGEHPLRIHLKKKEKIIKAQPQKIKLIPSR